MIDLYRYRNIQRDRDLRHPAEDRLQKVLRLMGLLHKEGVKMNNWHTEFMAEYQRQYILEDSEHIRLEVFALQSRTGRHGLFERTMFNFANWMISTGSQLRKRYEAPTSSCNNSPSGSLVS